MAELHEMVFPASEILSRHLFNNIRPLADVTWCHVREDNYVIHVLRKNEGETHVYVDKLEYVDIDGRRYYRCGSDWVRVVRQKLLDEVNRRSKIPSNEWDDETVEFCQRLSTWVAVQEALDKEPEVV